MSTLNATVCWVCKITEVCVALQNAISTSKVNEKRLQCRASCVCRISLFSTTVRHVSHSLCHQSFCELVRMSVKRRRRCAKIDRFEIKKMSKPTKTLLLFSVIFCSLICYHAVSQGPESDLSLHKIMKLGLQINQERQCTYRCEPATI